ncbi:hypothetical protein BASA50_007607 [Batrachochytrium salamandrivorans]|uniref:Uncharacterized protein n=1 Tax=Batrachochytrium salamandrivorans TaxID=1357716 RepID=A0ABQ8F9N3_9FUNG|nr:hypothetical protein BASA60_005631 [Batrachochytrium salamandrivorans]KAH6578140.1 hypothetical protein BASA62_000432 [Batrachochytrium salamandrivorans]KAH6582444.1 hypothetical protein BASA61_008553 [Batrachochytrium salamandrivorans]KAH6593086.1 hypothetical protein BASA50_007607 [Batrachochytrium salamandrivorans]KAH9266486.1 hypothetical protein BASA84_001123 [Batrachochytrium salamandrivorans]
MELLTLAFIIPALPLYLLSVFCSAWIFAFGIPLVVLRAVAIALRGFLDAVMQRRLGPTLAAWRALIKHWAATGDVWSPPPPPPSPPAPEPSSLSLSPSVLVLQQPPPPDAVKTNNSTAADASGNSSYSNRQGYFSPSDAAPLQSGLHRDTPLLLGPTTDLETAAVFLQGMAAAAATKLHGDVSSDRDHTAMAAGSFMHSPTLDTWRRHSTSDLLLQPTTGTTRTGTTTRTTGTIGTTGTTATTATTAAAILSGVDRLTMAQLLADTMLVSLPTGGVGSANRTTTSYSEASMDSDSMSCFTSSSSSSSIPGSDNESDSLLSALSHDSDSSSTDHSNLAFLLSAADSLSVVGSSHHDGGGWTDTLSTTRASLPRDIKDLSVGADRTVGVRAAPYISGMLIAAAAQQDELEIKLF